MNNEIFRKKNLDRISSPENLNDYVQVTSPGVWIVMMSIIILLIGACVWSFFGHVDTTVSSKVLVEDGKAVCLVDESIKEEIAAGMKIHFAGTTGKLSGGERTEKGYVFDVISEKNAADGVYDGAIVTESIHPATFILN